MYRGAAGAVGALTIMLASAGPAAAGYGSIAYDQFTGKLGASFDQATPAQANEQALRQCASADCRVHPVEPKGCGALAMSDRDQAWGGADRESLDNAERDAVLHCQAHTSDANCTVRVSGCNK